MPLYNNNNLNIIMNANTTNCIVGNPYKHKCTIFYPEELGSSVIKDGGFASDLSGWIYGNNWTFSSGKALCTAGNTNTIYQNVGLTFGQIYRLKGTATVSSGALIATMGGYSANMINNGSFAGSLTSWVYGTCWSYSSGYALCAITTQNPANTIYQTIATTIGQTYTLSLAATVSLGTLTATFGASSGSISITSTGTYNYTFTATDTITSVTFTPSATFSGAIDNVSVNQISNASGSLSISASGLFTYDFIPIISSNNIIFTPNASFAGSIDNITLQMVSTNITSLETMFWAYTTSTVTINMPSNTPNNLQYFNFTFSYTQAEGIGIREYTYNFYDNANPPNILQTYKQVGTSKTDFYVDGLASNQTYNVQVNVINQMGVLCTSTLNSFTVQYNQSQFVMTPSVIPIEDDNTINISWSASQIIGIPNDSSKLRYIPDFIYEGNYGLHIDSGGYVDYPYNGNENFTEYYLYAVDYNITGNLYEIDTTSHSYILSFDGTNIVYKKDGITLSTQSTTANGKYYWFVTMQPTRAVFRFISSPELTPSTTLAPSTSLYPRKLT